MKKVKQLNNSISKGENWIAATVKTIVDIAAIQQHKRYTQMRENEKD